jgi:hypothetical protein
VRARDRSRRASSGTSLSLSSKSWVIIFSVVVMRRCSRRWVGGLFLVPLGADFCPFRLIVCGVCGGGA